MCHHLLALLPTQDAEPADAAADVLGAVGGVVEFATPEFAGVRTADGAYRLIAVWGDEFSAARASQRA